MKEETSHLFPSRKETSRREFLQKGISVAGWGALAVGIGAGSYQTVRFFFPSVVFHPPSVFQIGRTEDFLSTEPPDAYGVISIDSRFKQDYRFFVVREAGRIYAMYARCTHLGCTVNWFPGLRIFKCPCHGSTFDSDGKWISGPARKDLQPLPLEEKPNGDVEVILKT